MNKYKAPHTFSIFLRWLYTFSFFLLTSASYCLIMFSASLVFLEWTLFHGDYVVSFLYVTQIDLKILYWNMSDFVKKFLWESKQLKTSSNVPYRTCMRRKMCGIVVHSVPYWEYAGSFSILHRVYYFSFSLYVYVTMVCVYVYMHVWLYVGTCVVVQRCGGLRLMWITFLSH